MRRFAKSIKSGLLAISLVSLLVACTANAKPTESSSESQTPVDKTFAFSLLEVPFTVDFPTESMAAIKAAPVSADWITEMNPLASTQITYTGEDGHANFLANAFWFKTAQLNKILDPNQPPPGTNMAVVGDRTLVVAVTVEMPYADQTADAETYGQLSEILREKNSYSKFVCSATSDLVTKPLVPEIRDIVTAYFQGMDLLPVTFTTNNQMLLSTQEQIVGIHSCFNPGTTGEAQYVGSVPFGATAAVMVYVQHKAYPATGATGSFVTLAKVGQSWSVVAEGTGP